MVKDFKLEMPAIDPSLFISRFASLLEFGDETQQVANDAVRLVQRFSRDWMSTGRRPAGICGASLILAARMNNFRRSIEEVVQVVKIADVTLKKRLEEFGETPTSRLTVTDFRAMWLHDDHDPPSFTENKKKEEAAKRVEARKQQRMDMKRVRFSTEDGSDEDLEDIEEENEDEDSVNTRPRKRGRTGLDQLGPIEEEDENREDQEGDPSTQDPNVDASNVNGDGLDAIAAEMAAMQDAGGNGLAEEEEEVEGGEEIDVTMDEEEEENMLDAIAASTAAEEGRELPVGPRRSRSKSPSLDKHLREQGLIGKRDLPPDNRTPEQREREEAEAADIRNDIQGELNAEPYTALSGVLSQKEQKRWIVANDPEAREGHPTWTGVDPLDDLDEDELDNFILTTEEVRIKERLWMEFNKDYLQNIALKHIQAEHDDKPVRKERKVSIFNYDSHFALMRCKQKKAKPRDSSTPAGATAAESTKQLLKQKKFSKKINYAVFDELLADDNGDTTGKRNNLFDGDDAQDQWETQSQMSKDGHSSRASSAAPSLTGSKKRKRSRSDSIDAEQVASKLKEKLTSKKKKGSLKRLPINGSSKKQSSASSTNNVGLAVKSAAAKLGAGFFGGSKGQPRSAAGEAVSGATEPEVEEPEAVEAEQTEDMPVEAEEPEEEEAEEEEEEEAQPEPEEDDLMADFNRLRQGQSKEADDW
jgi:transcription factor IIIB subunit 2